METLNRQLKVLVVEDEQDLRNTIVEVFQTFHWQACGVENGKQATDEMMKSKFDFVLSDIRMPVATGIDMLKNLPKEMKVETPIVMMSAYSDHTEKMLQGLGALKLIPKPVSLSALLFEMAACKNNRRAAV